jgi:glycosyltransferase involved in cell wall biosynthesis
MVTARVVRLVTRLNIGGPARQALMLTRELGDEFPTVLAAGRPSPTEGEMSDPEVTVRCVPLTRDINPQADISAVLAVRNLLRNTGAGVLHTHMAKAGTVGRLAASLVSDRPRTVHTFHGHVLDGYFSSIARRGFIAIERQLARRTDVLLAVSPQIRDELLDLGIGRPAQFLVISVGVDLAPYLAVNGPSGGLRAELGVDPSTPLVGTVGRLVAIKDHLTLLRAIERLANTHLVIVGDGELRPQLEAEVVRRHLGSRVHFTGWRYDLPDLYSDMDVVALTSLNEGTPVSIIEALAAQRPVVATNVGGVSHVVEDGRTGLLAPARDDKVIAVLLSSLLTNRNIASRLASAGRVDVASRFGETRLVQEIRDLYRTLLAAPVHRAS